MALSPARILSEGKTQYPWERDGVDFLKSVLPNTDPYHLAALFEVGDGNTARFYEIDALVVGYSAIYLVEIKSHPGLIEGDSHDWYWTSPDSPKRRYLENPLRLANHKCKILKSLLQRRMKERCPRIEPLVFLSAPGVQTRFDAGGEIGVVTRSVLSDAITRSDYPGSPLRSVPFNQRPSINKAVLRDLLAAMRSEPALRPRKANLLAGSYELGDVLRDGPGYQERTARHRDIARMEGLARVYLVPDQIDAARKGQLKHAAERECQLLWGLRDHVGILRANEFIADAPIGPTIIFDPFEDGQPLDAFLRRYPDLSLGERVSLIEQVARALMHCHKKSVVHGSVGPHAVLVRRNLENHELEARLTNFQLGASEVTSGTHHWTQLAGQEWGIYQCPDLRENPERTPAVDVYGLGALAYFVLTDKAPAATGAEAYARIVREKCLDPRVAKDGIDGMIANLIMEATRLSPAERADDLLDWTETLLDHATAPNNPVESIDPLLAKPGEDLGGLVVQGLLGQGATARVFSVMRTKDGREFALKVALEERHADRLREEASELRALHHQRIVQVEDELELGHRFALLLSLAGKSTLQKSLETEGVPSLDLAARYGEDLLSALEHLEEHGIIHRDIKPANLGVGGVGKGKHHLVLFDFSLARAPLDDLLVGTTQYRDPFLHARPKGRWDSAADRWSAAITLHELLTGMRPHFGEHNAVDDGARLWLAKERFDPQLRGGLIEFFERALAKNLADRFQDAHEMRRAWLAAVDEGRIASPAPTSPFGPRTFTEAELQKIDKTAPIVSLPLSSRAKNALDRAGLTQASHLLDLPDNRLSALKGVGRTVQTEIHAFREAWRKVLPAVSSVAPSGPVSETTPFFSNYRGPDLPLETLSMEQALRSALREAGIVSLGSLASTPRVQITRVLELHATDGAPSLAPLEALLRAHDRSPEDLQQPTSLEDWIAALVPPTKAHHHARALFGLTPPFLYAIDVPVKKLAQEEGCTPQAIYMAMTKSREAWKKHPAIGALTSRVLSSLATAGGMLPLRRAAARLADELDEGRPSGRAPELIRAEAAALVRIAADCDDEVTIFRHATGASETLFLLASASLAAPLRALGEEADRLAERGHELAQGEILRSLREAAEGYPELAAATDELLVTLATEASSTAALSARLELYPKGMRVERALDLCHAMFPVDITPEDLAGMVARRYPEAEPVPPRPALDGLLEVRGFRWQGNEQSGRYVRIGEMPGSSLHTHSPLTLPQHDHYPPTELDGNPLALAPTDSDADTPSPNVASPSASASVSHAPTAGAAVTRLRTPARGQPMGLIDTAAADFDEAMRLALELRTFRVLTISGDRVREAARALIARYGLDLVLLDKEIAGRLMKEAEARKISDLTLLHRADVYGSSGIAPSGSTGVSATGPGDWANLKRLADRATKSLATDLLPLDATGPADRPRLLAQPGLFDRYDLQEAFSALIERARDPKSPATFLLMGITMSKGGFMGQTGFLGLKTPIPGLLPAQILRIPPSFYTWSQAS